MEEEVNGTRGDSILVDLQVLREIYKKSAKSGNA